MDLMNITQGHNMHLQTVASDRTEEDISREKAEENHSFYHPTEIVAQILSWVPLNKMLESRRVCKSWFNSTLDHIFHSEHASRAPKSMSFIACKHIQSQLYKHFLFNVATSNVVPLRIGENYVVHSSCNGLLCIQRYQDPCFYIYNPITFQSLGLPLCQQTSNDRIEICFIPTTQVYKVLHLRREDRALCHPFILEICTVGFDTSWRTLDHRILYGDIGFRYPSLIQIGCSLYWLEDDGMHETCYLFSLDLESEQIKKLHDKKPRRVKHYCFAQHNVFTSLLFNWSGNLALLNHSLGNRIRLGQRLPIQLFLFERNRWDLKERICIENDLQWPISSCIGPLIAYMDGELFLSIYQRKEKLRNTLIAYNLETKRCKRLYEVEAEYIISHTNTLSSCYAIETIKDDDQYRRRTRRRLG